MKDREKQNKKKIPGEGASDVPQDEPMACYSAEQRRRVRKGLRILARVAIRAHMRRSAGPLDSEGDGDGQRDHLTDDSEGRRGV